MPIALPVGPAIRSPAIARVAALPVSILESVPTMEVRTIVFICVVISARRAFACGLSEDFILAEVSSYQCFHFGLVRHIISAPTAIIKMPMPMPWPSAVILAMRHKRPKRTIVTPKVMPNTYLILFSPHKVLVKEKGHRLVSFLTGGDGGIRTHVPISRQNDFESFSLRPLRYVSKFCLLIISESPGKVKASVRLFGEKIPAWASLPPCRVAGTGAIMEPDNHRKGRIA